jgi:hypothetical protein
MRWHCMWIKDVAKKVKHVSTVTWKPKTINGCELRDPYNPLLPAAQIALQLGGRASCSWNLHVPDMRPGFFRYQPTLLQPHIDGENVFFKLLRFFKRFVTIAFPAPFRLNDVMNLSSSIDLRKRNTLQMKAAVPAVINDPCGPLLWCSDGIRYGALRTY